MYTVLVKLQCCNYSPKMKLQLNKSLLQYDLWGLAARSVICQANYSDIANLVVQWEKRACLMRLRLYDLELELLEMHGRL